MWPQTFKLKKRQHQSAIFLKNLYKILFVSNFSSNKINASKIGTRHWKPRLKPACSFLTIDFNWVISINVFRCQLFLKIASHSIHMKCTIVTCAHFILLKIRTNNFCNSSQDKLKHLEISGQQYFCTDKSQNRNIYTVLSIIKFPITKQIIWLFAFPTKGNFDG